MSLNQVCCLCCTACSEYKSLQTDLHKSNEIYDITVKYFDPMLLTQDESTKSHHNPVLCRDCWFIINEFHEFQQKVLRARMTLEDKSNSTAFHIEVKPEEFIQENVPTSNTPDNGSLDISEYYKDNLFKHNLEYADLSTESLTSCKNSIESTQTDRKNEEDSSAIEVKGNSNFKVERAERLDAVIAEWKSEFICDLCNETVTCYGNMRSHFKEKHKAESYIKCCGRKFYRRSLLANHAIHHLNPGTYICDICGMSCTTTYGLKIHKNAIHEVREKFNCNICNKLYKSKVNLERHLSAHSKSSTIDRPKYPCKFCGIELLTASGIQNHMKAYHNADPTIYICSVCGKVSKTKIALQRHKNEVHAKVRNHKCTYCGKTFARRNTLREHIAGHTGEDLYKCPNCPQKFKIQSNVSIHRKRIHPVEWKESRKHRPQYPKINDNQVNIIL